MGCPPEPAVPAYSGLRMRWKYPQVLGLDLNCSESDCLVIEESWVGDYPVLTGLRG